MTLLFSTPKIQLAESDHHPSSGRDKSGQDAYRSTEDELLRSASGSGYEFIRNPAKKAFFESGALSSSGASTVSPRSIATISSPRPKQQVTFNEKDEEIMSADKAARYYCFVNSHRFVLRALEDLKKRGASLCELKY